MQTHENLLTTISLPAELVVALEEKCLLPVVGWGYPDFVSKIGLVRDEVTLVESRRIIVDRRDQEEAVHLWFEAAKTHLLPIYDTLADLPFDCIVALTPDRHLERTLQQEDSSWLALAPEQHDVPPKSRCIVPLGGSTAYPKTMILTDTEILTISHTKTALWERAESKAARAPLLIVGCDPSETALQTIIGQLRCRPPYARAGWILTNHCSQNDKVRWNNLGFELVLGSPSILLKEIARIANLPPAEAPAGPCTPAAPIRPYKHLDFFERSEASIFFGRAKDTARLVDMVCAHRLTVVTGSSGVGKTSLLNAGLLSSIDRIFGPVGVYCRCEDDPIAAIGHAASSAFGINPGFSRDGESLSTFMTRITNNISQAPVVVLDQAEELFTRTADKLRDDFLLALREHVLAPLPIARVVLCLREDYLPHLAECRERIPALLLNAFHLGPLDLESAREAILGPAAQAGIAFDKAVAETILMDLGASTIDPPQIQIVCTRLYEARRGKTIGNELYQTLGGAKGILEHYLRNGLRSLGSEEAEARLILKAMVTSEKTKDVLNLREIASRCGILESRTFALLSLLKDNLRVVRCVVQEDESRFELAHEYLTSEIWSWMNQQDLDRRMVEDLLAREVKAWRRYRTLRLGMDRLTVCEKNPNFVVGEDALLLVLLSSIKHQRDRTSWRRRIDGLDPAARDRVSSSLFAFFSEKNVFQRREAAEAIAELEPAPLLRALQTQSKLYCKAALQMIGGIEYKPATSQVADLARKSRDPNLRSLACACLGELDEPAAHEALREAVKDKNVSVRASAVVALGRTRKSGAHELIKKAIDSKNLKLVQAAKRAIQICRDALLIQQLLCEEGLSKQGRETLWDAIGNAEYHVKYWLANILDSLPQGEHTKATKLLDDSDVELEDSLLERLNALGGTLGIWAASRLKRSKKHREEFEARHEAAKKTISEHFTSDEIEILLSNRDFYTWVANAYRLGEISHSRVRTRNILVELLGSDEPRIRAGAMMAIERARLPKSHLVKVLAKAIKDDDPTVRYFACITADDRRIVELSEEIELLLWDKTNSTACRTVVGRTVGDAAKLALDTLRPSSKVWRKPFQEGFVK